MFFMLIGCHVYSKFLLTPYADKVLVLFALPERLLALFKNLLFTKDMVILITMAAMIVTGIFDILHAMFMEHL